MLLLTQFLLRLAFGLAVGMAVTSPRLVSSGYYRNHLYVTLGLSSLAALAASPSNPALFWYSIATAVVSYVGSVAWLYEKPRAGRVILAFLALIAFFAALCAEFTLWDNQGRAIEINGKKIFEISIGIYGLAQVVTSGLLLGFTIAAMLLGHWYLNAPGMTLEPLRKLIALMAIAVALHALVCGHGLWSEASLRETETTWWIFVALRWLFGLFGVVAMAWMAWQTLKIPNTQSATGILYVAVIGAFVGETMSLLLSAESLFPL